MDCPSEEQMIRMKLDDLTNIQSLEFDIPNRLLHVFHIDNNEQIFQRLDTLKFDTSILSTVSVDNFTATDNQNDERKTLWTVLNKTTEESTTANSGFASGGVTCFV